MKKMQRGGSITTKTKYVSPGGNYKGSQKIKETPNMYLEKSKDRRTLKGALTGAEKVNVRRNDIIMAPSEPEDKMKRGGSVKRKKK